MDEKVTFTEHLVRTGYNTYKFILFEKINYNMRCLEYIQYEKIPERLVKYINAEMI